MVLSLLCSAVAAFAQQPPPARVVVAKVFEKELAPTTFLLGTVDFDIKSGISPEISGLIEKQLLIEGTVVRKGALLVQLNSEFIRKDMDILNKESAQLDVKIANTRKNLKRLEALFAQNVTSEKDYDDLAALLRELQTQREALVVRFEKKKLELTKSDIRAPYNGLVLERIKSEGEWVSPGVSICQLAAVDDVVVKVPVSEDLVRYVQSGQILHITIPSLGQEISGKVKTVVPKVEAKSRTFDIKVNIQYQEGLLQNMSARVDVPTGPRKTLKMIKRDALVRFQGKEFVYTVKEGTAKLLPIEVVAVEGEYLGVAAPHIVVGMPVVIDGNERLQPDQAVQVIEEPAPGPAEKK
jgi:RND family efflux transporter MFP subunit